MIVWRISLLLALLFLGQIAAYIDFSSEAIDQLVSSRKQTEHFVRFVTPSDLLRQEADVHVYLCPRREIRSAYRRMPHGEIRRFWFHFCETPTLLQLPILWWALIGSASLTFLLLAASYLWYFVSIDTTSHMDVVGKDMSSPTEQTV